MELERALRSHLKVSRATLPDAQLRGLWLFLDENLSGAIDAGEFGRFMRRAMRNGGGLSSVASESSLYPSRGWRPAFKVGYEDKDADDEEEIALSRERRRAEAETERLKRQAQAIAEALKRRGEESSTGDATTSGGDGGHASGSGSASAANLRSMRGGSVSLPQISRRAASHDSMLPERGRRKRGAPKGPALMTLQAYGHVEPPGRKGRMRVGAPKVLVRPREQEWSRQLQEEADRAAISATATEPPA